MNLMQHQALREAVQAAPKLVQVTVPKHELLVKQQVAKTVKLITDHKKDRGGKKEKVLLVITIRTIWIMNLQRDRDSTSVNQIHS